MALGGIAVAAGRCFALHPLVLRGCRSVIHDEVHDAVGADIAETAAENHREDLVFPDGIVQRRNQVFFAEGAGLEELLHQLVIAFGNQFNQPLVRFEGLIFQIGRDLGLFPLAVATHLVGVSLHADEVDDARETFFAADGQLDRNHIAAKCGGQGFKHAIGVGAVAVHTIDDDQAGRLVLFAIIPDALGDDLHSSDAIDHDDGGVDHGEDHLGFVHEHIEAGGVEDVDFRRAPFDDRAAD